MGVLFAELFRAIGVCRLPISIGPALANQLLSRWAATSSDPAVKEYFEIVSRNVHRARVRLTMEKYRG